MATEKKTGKSLFKRLLRDAFFCACFIYGALRLIQLVPLNSEWLQPANNAFKDFDWSDIYFSQIKNLKTGGAQNPDIVVINVDDASRKEITQLLNRINEAKPKVVGLDLMFQEARDSIADAELDNAIKIFNKKITIACFADSTSGNSIYTLQPLAVPKLGDADNLGYVNFIGDENETVRTFYKVQNFKDGKMPSFAFNTFIKYNDKGDLNAYKEELSADESIISYQSLPEHFFTVNYKEILDSGINFNLLTNKIVLLGFCGSSNGTQVIDDKHFTPLNENYAGKALPDMYGIYIHANIIEAYIDGYKIYNPSAFAQIAVCIIFIFLFLLLYLYSEAQEHLWQAVVEIMLQLVFGFVLLMMAVYFLSNTGMKWNIGEMVAAVALAEPLIGFYRVIIHYLSKVYGFKSIFNDED